MKHHGSKDIAVLHINAIGDQVLAWPAMRALDRLFPGRIKLVLGAGMRSVFYRDVQLKTIFRARLHDRAADANPERILVVVEPLVRELGLCEIFIVLSDWCNESISAVVDGARPRRSIGFGSSFGECVEVASDVHMFDKIFAAVQCLDPSLVLEDFCGWPKFSPAAIGAAERLKDKHLLPEEKLLFVHPETLPLKTWARAHYNDVLPKFLKERREYRILVCTQQQFELGSHPRIHAISPHLELAMALVGLSDCFLGVDSCFLHAADLYGLPGVALFGPTNPDIWGFRLSKTARHISGGGSIENLSEEEVLEALLQVAP